MTSHPDTSAGTTPTHDSPTVPPREAAPLLYTPAQAARLLAVRESWLRRRAGQRTIPCTFIGKHLRFSPSDLRAIVDFGQQTRPTPGSRPRRTRRR